MRSIGFAISCILGILVWLAFCFVMLVGSSLGDGTTGMPVVQGRVLLIPVIYLLILFLCCFRFVSGVFLSVGKLLAALTLGVFAVGAFSFGWQGFLLWIPFVPYVIASKSAFHVEKKVK